MTKDSVKKGTLSQIIAAVVIALLVGSTSPWWWNEIFHKNKTTPQPPPNYSSSTNKGTFAKPILGGPIKITATTDPPVISKGQKTTINVFAQDFQGNPLSSATVTLSAGGGKFDQTGTTKAAGQTDLAGIFRAYWSCDYCAPVYIGSVRVIKSGYEKAKSQWRVEIH